MNINSELLAAWRAFVCDGTYQYLLLIVVFYKKNCPQNLRVPVLSLSLRDETKMAGFLCVTVT